MADPNCDHRRGRADLGRLAGVFRDLLRCYGQVLPLRRLFGCGGLGTVAAKRAGGRRALAMRRADLRIGGIREGNLYFLQAPFFIYKKAARSCAKSGWHGAEAVLYYGYNKGKKGRLVAAPGTNEKTGFALRSHGRMRAAGAAGGVGAKERRSVCPHRGGQAGCPSAGRPCQFGRSG